MSNLDKLMTFLEKNREQFGVLAYQGYKLEGKGVLILYFDQSYPATFRIKKPADFGIEYISNAKREKIDERGGWPITDIWELVGKYDPETQIVVLGVYGEEFHLVRFGDLPLKKLGGKFDRALARHNN